MINSVVLVGRLVRDTELRTFTNGTDVINFTIAVPRNFKNANGEYETDFIDCIVTGNMAKTMHSYCEKGDVLGLRGRIQKRNYETQDGTKKYITEVVVEKLTFLSSKPKTEENYEVVKTDENVTPNEDPFEQFNSEVSLSDEDLPF